MRIAMLIARREFLALVSAPSAFLIAGTVLCVDGMLFNALVLGGEPKTSQRVLEELFQITSGTTMVSAILLAARLFAEERSAGTLVLLLHSPVRDVELVLGKFLGAAAFLALIVLCHAHLLWLVSAHGTLALGHVLVGATGLLLLGGAALAIGLLGSVIAPSQWVAALLSGAVLVTLLLGWLLARVSEPPWSEVMAYVALWEGQFLPLQRGVLGLSNVVYFLSVTAVFLGASVVALGGRRWD